MAYNLIINPEAYQDIDDGMAWYKEQKIGLEAEFYSEVFEVIDYIREYPKHFQKKYKVFRVRYTSKFPYGIHYTIEGKTIYVHAVFHTSKKPRSTEKL